MVWDVLFQIIFIYILLAIITGNLSRIINHLNAQRLIQNFSNNLCANANKRPLSFSGIVIDAFGALKEQKESGQFRLSDPTPLRRSDACLTLFV